jgi:hypothetical protein
VALLSGNPRRGSRPEANFAWRIFEVVVGMQAMVMAMVVAMVVAMVAMVVWQRVEIDS